jgi:hypothetical protein
MWNIFGPFRSDQCGFHYLNSRNKIQIPSQFLKCTSGWHGTTSISDILFILLKYKPCLQKDVNLQVTVPFIRIVGSFSSKYLPFLQQGFNGNINFQFFRPCYKHSVKRTIDYAGMQKEIIFNSLEVGSKALFLV